MSGCFCQPFFSFSSKLFSSIIDVFLEDVCRRFQRRGISYQSFRQKSTLFLFFIFIFFTGAEQLFFSPENASAG
jgi:hypothetical protein